MADKFLIPKLQNQVMKIMIKSNPWKFIGRVDKHELARIHEKTSADSPLRHLPVRSLMLFFNENGREKGPDYKVYPHEIPASTLEMIRTQIVRGMKIGGQHDERMYYVSEGDESVLLEASDTYVSLESDGGWEKGGHGQLRIFKHKYTGISRLL